MHKIEDKLRKIHRELFPDGQSDHWSPTAGELVLAAYFDRQIADVTRSMKHYVRDRRDSA